MNDEGNNAKIVPGQRADISLLNSSLAKRGLQLLAKPSIKDALLSTDGISALNAWKVTKIAQFGEGRTFRVMWSHDGSALIAAKQSGLYLYAADDLSKSRVTGEPAILMSPSADGASMATASPQGDVSIWNVPNWKLRRRWRTSERRLRSLALSASGDLLATCADGENVQVWKTADGALVHTLENFDTSTLAPYNDLNILAFSPDGADLAVGSPGEVRIWRLADLSRRRTLRGQAQGILEVCFSRDGTVLLSGSIDETILWDLASGSVVRAWRGECSTCHSLSTDGRLVAWADCISYFIHVCGWEEDIWLSDEHPFEPFTSSAFSPNGEWLATSSGDKTISLWNVRTHSLHKRTAEASLYYGMDITPDGRYLAARTRGGVDILGLSDGGRVRSVEPQFGIAAEVAISPDGNLLAAGYEDGRVHLWRLSDGSLLRTLEGHPGMISSLAFSPTGGLLASAAGQNEQTIRIWIMQHGDGLWIKPASAELAGIDFSIFDQTWTEVTFSPDGLSLVTRNDRGDIEIWRMPEGRLVRTVPADDRAVGPIAFSPDGAAMAAVVRQKIHVWNTSDGALLRTFGHNEGRYRIAFSPDSSVLAVSTWPSGGNALNLWSAEIGLLLANISDTRYEFTDVRFSRDGKLFLASSLDGIIRVWGVPP